MASSVKDIDFIEKKAGGVLKVNIAILFSICGILLYCTEKDAILTFVCIESIIFTVISIYCIYGAIKVRKYTTFGSVLRHALKQDPYYHDEIGVKLYLSQLYESNAINNIKINNEKSKFTDRAIWCLFIMVEIVTFTIIIPHVPVMVDFIYVAIAT